MATEQTIKELREDNFWELKKTINDLKENTYYYFIYFDDVIPCCTIRKFKNAMWQYGFPYCSIYDIDNSRPITFLANSPYDLVQDKDYIYVKFSRGYAGVFYITKSLQTAHNVLRKECRGGNPNLMHVSHKKFYKDCIKRLKEFATNPSLVGASIGTDFY